MNYTPQEERWNARSHALGIVLALVVGIVFFRKSIAIGDAWLVLGIALYLFGMLASYISSTVYHSTPLESPRREEFRRWDHAAIYWFIAGSYSPIMLFPMRHEGAWGWSIFAFVWTAALIGTIASFRRLKAHSHLETLCFCLMGHRRVDHRRGRLLHHRRHFLLDSPPIHAHRIPLFRPRRHHLPHPRRLEHFEIEPFTKILSK